MKKWLTFVFMCFVGALIAGAMGLVAWIWHVDRVWSPVIEPRIQERAQIGSIRVLGQDPNGQSRWIGSITAGRMEERQFLRISELPTQLIQSIVVLEDPRFLEHGGFDIWGIGRAMLVNLSNLRFSQGGSTLTQQLVKNVFLTREKTLRRKITELILAAMIEHRFSKDEILEAYINEIYLGQLGSIEIHGVGRASEYYFNKKVDRLEIHEMALLAAMIAGPGVYNPWRAPEKTIARRDRVLKSLLEAQLILEEEYSEAIAKPLPPKSTFIAPTRAAYMMDALRENLIQTRSEVEIVNGGFDLKVGLDLELQELAEKTLRERAQNDNPNFQALLVAADPKTCEIRAYVGGTNYQITQLDRIRLSARPIGSLMKPLEIAPLLENEDTVNLAMMLEDRPLEWVYDKGRGKWNPANYDKKYREKVTLRRALEESLNIPIVRLFFERYPQGNLSDAYDSVRALGLEIPEERALPSSLLGAIEQKPWNVLKAYLKLVRQALGLAKDPGDSDCRLSLEAQTEPTPLEVNTDGSGYGQKGARLVISALEGAIRRGTSQALGNRLPTNQAWAGKTGTSSDLRDAWYVAMSPDLVVLSWTGHDDYSQTKFTGASGAMPLAIPIVLAQSKRNQFVDGWSWPSPSVFWKPVATNKFCRAPELLAALIKSAIPEPLASTPPPDSFKYEGSDYYYELFRSGAEADECP